MLRFYGPSNALQKAGFVDTGDSHQFLCHFDRKTGKNHILKFKFKTYIPKECNNPYAKCCLECEYHGDCDILRVRLPDGKIYHKAPDAIFIEGFSTDDSNPDKYLLNLVGRYIKEI